MIILSSFFYLDRTPRAPKKSIRLFWELRRTYLFVGEFPIKWTKLFLDLRKTKLEITQWRMSSDSTDKNEWLKCQNYVRASNINAFRCKYNNVTQKRWETTTTIIIVMPISFKIVKWPSKPHLVNFHSIRINWFISSFDPN